MYLQIDFTELCERYTVSVKNMQLLVYVSLPVSGSTAFMSSQPDIRDL